jgi:glucokinase
MNRQTIIGIDLGGTNVRAGLVNNNNLSATASQRINAQGSVEKVLQQLFELTDPLINKSVTAIGIGVPGLVDLEQGVVFDVINIAAWKEVPLKKLMEDRYAIPVLINNDANCFALGEFYFGKGRGHDSMLGLTVGTGLGSGIILNKKLYGGKTGGAGEFGMMDYQDKYYEYYASGQFFQNVYGAEGESVFKKAIEGNSEAIEMYGQMGMHLGNAIKAILYALDINLIIMGGSVSKAYHLFSKTMWQQIETFAYRRTIDGLQIEVSELENSGILGAAALHYDQ